MLALWFCALAFTSLQRGVDATTASNYHGNSSFELKPLTIDLSRNAPHMIDLIRRTHLPQKADYLDPEAGIALETLTSLQKEWVTDFDWEREQQNLNKLDHFTAEIENLTVHFIHEKSYRSDAIPLILNHGWPGSFLEFIPLIELLKKDFNIIIPSLPGFALSSAPPAGWTVADTARVFNILMTDVLGYQNLSPLENFELLRFEDWETNGNGYFIEQTTEPNSIGFALYDNPVGHLTYIGGKFIDWSDPRAGKSPSVLNQNEIIKSVSLYYLTKSIVSSVYIYYENPGGFSTTYTEAETDAPMLFSAFKYNIAFWPPELVARVGNLVSYSNHEFGGHFPGLDNPTALAEDLKKIKQYWA